MSRIYEDYYTEITAADGTIQNIETRYDEHFNFAYDVVDRHARECPEKLALVHRSTDGIVTRYTFADIKRLSDKAANAFLAQGIGRGDAVMLLLKRRAEFWVAIVALHKLGAVAVPTSHMVSAEDIAARAKAADVKAIVCAACADICEKVAEAVDGTRVIPITAGGTYAGWLDFTSMIEEAAEEFGRVETAVTDNMLYYFTSGTNGAPKAVIHDFSYPIAHIYTALRWHGATDGGLHLTVADSGWAKSAWGKLYGQWFVGSAVCVYDYENFYAGEMLRLIAEEGITTFCAPPTIYKYFILEDLESYDFSGLVRVTTAGEPMPAEVAKRFTAGTGLTIRDGFGQTETALQICTPVGGTPVAGSIGKSSPLYQLMLLDEDGVPVPVGEEGEIVIVPKNGERPIGVFKGYLGEPERYAEVWRGGVYHTGDKARIDADGNFFFVGRNDDVIKSSGYRIGPSEVEDILMRHPAVFECAVTGYPSKTRGTVVKASVILNQGFRPEGHLKTDLQDFVKERAAIYKYPRIIEFAEELPRTSNGKISRAQIRKRDNAAFLTKL
ncbi:MAG: AMP-binding protein [Lachnospiraceae bacterium]|nr:AMP-binding protein [Lachnospiraceae bacterium]